MEYRVLARKYRPTSFVDLIGQEVLVRTLSNAIASGRIAHAFLLTGIRGVGKTTTARIIARALNCEQGPTITPCGECSQCRMIAEDRHPDVLEMDAASRTGVGDIRELIDTVRYLPSSARYKIYIIDEVHMLSTSAFNALLKTLEEPPERVKFIFATTELRKIPVTILSRCQRFDLKRVEVEVLAQHLKRIAEKESVQAQDEALKLISIAAEGSVRDSLSLLDQAIAHASGEGITAERVRQMLGLADSQVYFDLLEALLGGKPGEALALAEAHYRNGADPLLMAQGLLDVTHLLTRLVVTPQAAGDVALSEAERSRARALSAKLTMPVLTRLWQMLLKGAAEIKTAPQPMAALEMLLVRVAYASELPTPGEAIRGIRQAGSGIKGSGGAVPVSAQPFAPMPSSFNSNLAPAYQHEPVAQSRPALQLVAENAPQLKLGSFEELAALFEEKREPILYTHLLHDAALVEFADGTLSLSRHAGLPRDFASRVEGCLKQWTGQRWQVKLLDQPGGASLHEQRQTRKQERIAEARGHALVSSVLKRFPGAEILDVDE